MKLKSAIIVAAVASAFSVSAQAATTIFSDNFNSYTANALSWAPQNGWSVTNNGNVDLIGKYPWNWFQSSNGNYIDLDGTSSPINGQFTNSVNNLIAGTTYTLSFDLAGSQRPLPGNPAPASPESVIVKFGTTTATYTLPYNIPFLTFTLNFTPVNSGLYTFSFQNQGPSDNVGALLDNVTVTAVPEPQSYAMIMAGLGLMGFIVRRRKNGQV